ncbi:carbohydrate ABC transporter permease [Paenibacillus glycanilyticus]|uniref:Sugar ABC transporter permease n=1 Tax=Paenibacillus glycanilyticus TaxID=126569 RepID=A0ABQ6GBH4_9BACL|nr:carbohydrate ABC transporter permease [Paenibacillus glycanilyticus]GLX66951.1 sugar ABC transporter permease [Paenibacillus glycanilyticus]
MSQLAEKQIAMRPERVKRKKFMGAQSVSPAAYYTIIVCLTILSLACVVPLLLVIMTSFTDESSLTLHGYQFIPAKFSFYAYDYLMNDFDKIARGYGISAFVTIVGTAASLLLISLFAYPVSRPDFPYRNIFLFLVFFTMLFHGGLVPWYLIYVKAGLKDTMMALILPSLIVPFNLIIVRTFFANTIPHALVESAKIDGASEWRIYARIIMPLSLPVLATIGLFQTLIYWNDWYTSLIFISSEKLVNIQYLLYRVISDMNYLNSGFANQQAVDGVLKTLPAQTVRMAMAVVGIGPIVIVYPFIAKYFVKGLTVGAVKG